MAFRGGLYFDNLLGVSDSWNNIAEERANFMFTLITFIICQGLWLLTVMESFSSLSINQWLLNKFAIYFN